LAVFKIVMRHAEDRRYAALDILLQLKVFAQKQSFLVGMCPLESASLYLLSFPPVLPFPRFRDPDKPIGTFLPLLTTRLICSPIFLLTLNLSFAPPLAGFHKPNKQARSPAKEYRGVSGTSGFFVPLFVFSSAG